MAYTLCYVILLLVGWPVTPQHEIY